MNDVNEIDYDNDLEEDDDDDSVYMPKLLKQENVNSSDNDSDDESVGDNPKELSVEDVSEVDEDVSPPPA